MNVFLPYEDDIVKSVQSLDDVRLNKQILETYQLLTSANKEFKGEEIKGYKNHPVYLHYKHDQLFLAGYGFACCQEYTERFKKEHKLGNVMLFWFNYWEYRTPRRFGQLLGHYTPYYMEGSKGQPNYIRTTKNVGELFRQKLIKKWEQDKAKGRQPKWTNREVPQFYHQWLKENGDEQN